MSDIPNIGSIDNLSLDSGILIIQDDCFKYVTVAEFLKLFAESGGGGGSGSGSIVIYFKRVMKELANGILMTQKNQTYLQWKIFTFRLVTDKKPMYSHHNNS